MIKGFNYVYARKLMDEKKLTYSDLINLTPFNRGFVKMIKLERCLI